LASSSFLVAVREENSLRCGRILALLYTYANGGGTVERLRLAEVCPTPPWHRGGVERVVGEISKRLVKWFEVTIIATQPTPSRARWEGVEVAILRGGRATGYAPIEMHRFRKLINDADIVHVHGAGTLLPLAVVVMAKRCATVVSPHYHTSASSPLMNLAKLPHDTAIFKILAKRVQTWCFVSEAERQHLLEFGLDKEANMVVIPNGVDHHAVRNADPLPVSGKVILYVGRLERYKGIEQLVSSLRHLPAQYKLWIVGDGPDASALLRMAQGAGVQSRVEILRGIPDEHLWRIYKTASVFVSLSRAEAFGIATLEALAAGCPALVAETSGLARDYAGELEGLIPIDPDSLDSRSLAQLIDAHSRTRVKSDLSSFSWDNIAERYRGVYVQSQLS